VLGSIGVTTITKSKYACVLYIHKSLCEDPTNLTVLCHIDSTEASDVFQFTEKEHKTSNMHQPKLSDHWARKCVLRVRAPAGIYIYIYIY